MSLPVFGFVTVHEAALSDGMACERDWLARVAATGRASAHLWRSPPALVAPRSHARLPHWAQVCAISAAEGWPVQLRLSGGGLVPQGPGMLNLSLIWPAGTASPSSTDAIYRALTDELAAAFARLGIEARTQPVEGSFCDGRFNLAVGGRKCVGTAQAWRRVGGRPLVLAHAVVIATADPVAMTEVTNRFEVAAGGARRYRADALTSLAQAWCDAHRERAAPADLQQRIITVIAERFARIVPPRVHPESATTTQET
jgi:lipoate-protein ligase A